MCVLNSVCGVTNIVVFFVLRYATQSARDTSWHAILQP